ncbi:MAG TPA: HAMP domain-containing sensor histidine kinase [Actinomycetota bacterium]|nr:HAMP domain-containing sensor histidine kinase [Actinomycetota bacterium]
MSLRARLLLVTVGLVAAGLLVANVATFQVTRTFLERRVDEQLTAARPFAATALTDGGSFGQPPPGVVVPPGTYAEFRSEQGDVVAATTFGYEEAVPAPLPADLPAGGDDRTVGFTVGGQGTSWRALATTLPGLGTLIVAVPLTETTAMLRQLLGVELVASAVVLAAAIGLALWLVRLGLKPLEDMGTTADAIAAGDLSRRVTPAETGTEVGRLGMALNAMLSQIEAAFEQRTNSEDRLRRFVADASHELRTPLTSIRGYAELFRRGAEARPEDLARSMAAIETEAARMGVLVDDLLLLARLDQGRPLELESVDLGAIAGEAVDAARAIDPGRAVSLQVDDGDVWIDGDAGKLRQVLDNLLDNARVHTPEGTPAHVRVFREGDDAIVSVSDEGPGLSPEARARVFERFYRDDGARSRETGGAGLGLAIVAAIAQAHGGEVSAGAPATGAAFELRFPVHGDPAPPPPEPEYAP